MMAATLTATTLTSCGTIGNILESVIGFAKVAQLIIIGMCAIRTQSWNKQFFFTFLWSLFFMYYLCSWQTKSHSPHGEADAPHRL